MKKPLFLIEKTDTFGGEPNYAWVKRVYVHATTERGAISKARRHWGCGSKIRRVSESGDLIRWDFDGVPVCYFCESVGEDRVQGVEVI